MLAALGWIVGEFVADKKLLVNADGRIGGEHSAIDSYMELFTGLQGAMLFKFVAVGIDRELLFSLPSPCCDSVATSCSEQIIVSVPQQSCISPCSHYFLHAAAIRG